MIHRETGPVATRRPQARRRSGFSLIELLVVIVIVAVLAGLLLPAIRMVKEMALTSGCASNQRQMGTAFMIYAQDNDGALALGRVIKPSSYSATNDVYWYTTSFIGSIMSEATSSTNGLSNNMRCPKAKNTTSLGPCATVTPEVALTDRYGLFIFPSWAQSTSWNVAKVVGASNLAQMTDIGGGGTYWGLATNLTAPSYDANPGTPAYWTARHNGGCNLLFFDGHVEFVHDLTTLVAKGTVRVHPFK